MPNHKKTTPTGKRYGRWTVLDHGHVSNPKNVYLNCRCDCGTTKLIRRQSLECGQSKSCGCRTKEINKKLNTKHGMYYHRLYVIWSNMMRRCYNKNDAAYPRYGGRGIVVSKRWHDIKNFVEDMWPSYSEGLTLDRKNNNGNYTKHNCRWATYKEQSLNTSKNLNYEYNGETLTLKELSCKYNISYSRLYSRTRLRGWEISEAINCPKRINQFH